MKSYNVKIKQKNNNEWNIIQPYTKAKNVSLSNGINLEEVNNRQQEETTNIKEIKDTQDNILLALADLYEAMNSNI